MSIFQILPPDFRNSLPDDERLAFGMIVERATDWLDERLKEVDERESSSWNLYESHQLSAMNLIIASAKHYGIKPFDSMVVPRRSNFNSADFTEFKGDLDHYLVQIMLDNTMRSRRDAVEMQTTARDGIRKYLHGLKELIDKADMSEGKKSALHNKLLQFENELQKGRVPVFALARILLEVVSLSANVVALSDSPTFHKLVSNAFQAVAEAKASDDDKRQLPPTERPRALMPPRPPEESGRKKVGPKESFDLDDEIPF